MLARACGERTFLVTPQDSLSRWTHPGALGRLFPGIFYRTLSHIKDPETCVMKRHEASEVEERPSRRVRERHMAERPGAPEKSLASPIDRRAPFLRTPPIRRPESPVRT